MTVDNSGPVATLVMLQLNIMLINVQKCVTENCAVDGITYNRSPG